MPWKMQAMATTPGTSKLEKAAAPDPVPPTPWPILGNTYVKTNTNSSGCMTVRRAKTPMLLRNTARSRIRRAAKAFRAGGAVAWRARDTAIGGAGAGGGSGAGDGGGVVVVTRGGPFR